MSNNCAVEPSPLPELLNMVEPPTGQVLNLLMKPHISQSGATEAEKNWFRCLTLKVLLVVNSVVLRWTVSWGAQDLMETLHIKGLVQVLLLFVTVSMCRGLDTQEERGAGKEDLIKQNNIFWTSPFLIARKVTKINMQTSISVIRTASIFDVSCSRPPEGPPAVLAESVGAVTSAIFILRGQ